MDEKIVKEYGFEDLNEFHNLVSNVDLSDSLKILKFKNWQENDGSKDGLLKL